MLRLVSFLGVCLLLFSLSIAEASEAVKADLIEVRKAERRMVLIADGEVIAEYAIALGDNPLDHKQQEGDERTPEGSYVIDFKNENSRYHLSLRISYPNSADRTRAERAGVSPGGDIFIHGLPEGMSFLGAQHRRFDWTDGCIAVTSEEIEEIWDLVSLGTEIVIYP